MVRWEPVGVSRLQIFFVLGASATCSPDSDCDSSCDSAASFVVAQPVSNRAKRIVKSLIKLSLKINKLLGQVANDGQYKRIGQGHNYHPDVAQSDDWCKGGG